MYVDSPDVYLLFFKPEKKKENMKREGRASNDSWSMDNGQSELGIDHTNPWITGYVLRSYFTHSKKFPFLTI